MSQWGAFGAVLIVSWLALGFWIVKLTRNRDTDQVQFRADLNALATQHRTDLNALHERRAEELKAVTDRVLKLAEAHNSVQQAQASATNAVADRLDDLLLLVRSLQEGLPTRRK